MKKVVICSSFGHEIMSLNFAKAFGYTVVVVSKKESKEEYEAEAQKIYDTLSPFYDKMEIVPFEDKDAVEAWDVISDLKTQNLSREMWKAFAKTTLTLDAELKANLPVYEGLAGKKNVLFIPQKLISDGKCGITAQQQSLPLEVFEFLKTRSENFVLGQHFHKVNDRSSVEDLAREYNLYVPGAEENPEVFGIRGVPHKAYYNMYESLSASVGIAGTHTWLLLTLFPEVPQIILFNKKGLENWKAIEQAYQECGYNIFCIGFDEDTDMGQLSREIEKKYQQLL